MHLIANAFSFDHYTHIRADLLAPSGPLDRPAPQADERHLNAAADWIIAGIPQMSPGAVVEPVELVLTGPGSRTARFGPDREPVATVTSSIADLVLWSTGRRSWQEVNVRVDGDPGAQFCDAVHVF